MYLSIIMSVMFGKSFSELISDYVMHFTTSGTTDYVTLPGPTHNLTEVKRIIIFSLVGGNNMI